MTAFSARYSAIQEEDGSWSVVENLTLCAVKLSGEPLVLLDEHFAETLASFLNLEEEAGTGSTVH